jgi:hypothetical protein
MATASVAKKSPELPDHVLRGTARASALDTCYRATALMECIRSAGFNTNEPLDGANIATVATVAAEMVRQVLDVLDEAPRAQGGAA